MFFQATTAADLGFPASKASNCKCLLGGSPPLPEEGRKRLCRQSSDKLKIRPKTCEIQIQWAFERREYARRESVWSSVSVDKPYKAQSCRKAEGLARRLHTPDRRRTMTYSKDWLQVSKRVSICVLLIARAVIANSTGHVDPAQEDTQEKVSEPSFGASQHERGLRFDDRPLSLQLRLGAATIVGEIGIVAEYDISDRLNVGLGIGTNTSGPMPGAHVRLRPLVFRDDRGSVAHAVVGEAGVSVGYYDPGILTFNFDVDHPDPPKYVPKLVVWWQLEAGWEARWATGLLVRSTIGVAQCFVNPTLQYSYQGKQYTTNGDGAPPRAFVATLATGYAF